MLSITSLQHAHEGEGVVNGLCNVLCKSTFRFCSKENDHGHRGDCLHSFDEMAVTFRRRVRSKPSAPVVPDAPDPVPPPPMPDLDPSDEQPYESYDFQVKSPKRLLREGLGRTWTEDEEDERVEDEREEDERDSDINALQIPVYLPHVHLSLTDAWEETKREIMSASDEDVFDMLFGHMGYKYNLA